MSQIEIPSEILSMSVADRIELVAKIWDSISEEAAVGLSDQHRRILEQRLADHRKNPDEGTSWQQLKSDLRGDQ